ncbi:helix-turn-helix domain-containing protein [Streptomyces sp. URMC 124]|uniref:helix-turn-helix domain-containing protein n=1 Tax=Streptomyces sp. URMC 124 TaxID=3423405 RepID=UPI003F1CE732
MPNPKKPPAYLTGHDRQREAERLAPLYRAGATIRQLAADTGRSYGVTRNLLLFAGVKLRQRGGEPRPTPTSTPGAGGSR